MCSIPEMADSGDLEAPSLSQWKKADASENLACLSQKLQEGDVNAFPSQYLGFFY